MFDPLRQLGVPEPLIDVVEPFFRVIVDLGYDRSIPPWEPTPARLIPPLNPVKVTTDLVTAIGEGINNAAALVGLPPLLSIPAPVTLAAPAAETATADISPQVTSTDTPTQTEQVTVDGTGDAKPNGDRSTVMETANPRRNVRKATESNGHVGCHADRIPQVSSARQVTEPPGQRIVDGPTATPEPSASASTPKPAKLAGQPAKTRPVVRDSLGVGQQLPDRSHRGEGEQPTTRTGAAGAGAATGARSLVASSSAASSSTGSSSRGASGGDGHCS